MSEEREDVRFGPDGTALFPVVVVAVCSLPLAFSSRWLLVVLLVPLACAVWVLRARTVLSPQGVQVCNGLGVTDVPWPQVEGFDVPRHGPVRLLTGGRRLVLTTVPRRRARELVAASEAVQASSG